MPLRGFREVMASIHCVDDAGIKSLSDLDLWLCDERSFDFNIQFII